MKINGGEKSKNEWRNRRKGNLSKRRRKIIEEKILKLDLLILIKFYKNPVRFLFMKNHKKVKKKLWRMILPSTRRRAKDPRKCARSVELEEKSWFYFPKDKTGSTDESKYKRRKEKYKRK